MRLAIANLAIFLIIKLLWLTAPEGTVDAIVNLMALPATPSSLLSAPWTLLTYMFIHIDFWHLVINCLWLAWFGALLTEVAGRRWLLADFFIGGTAGAVMFLIVAPMAATTSACLLGSSAAVFAVITATLISAPQKRVTLALIGTFSLRWVAAVGMALFFLASIEMEPSQIAAHLGGIATGTVSAIIWKLHTRRDMETMKNLTRNRLDHLALVDKVNRNGYTSLTRQEQLRLFNLSTENRNRRLSGTRH